MKRYNELNVFLERAGELIDSTYILADVKIAGLLKSIAVSDTMVAMFKNCLSGFDYEGAKKKYFVQSKYLKDKCEFVLPSNQRELLAFIFTILVDIDANRISLAQFINKYFFEDGSYSSGYSAFINAMIKPFKNSVKMLFESVLEGKLQDPIEALSEEEAKQKEREEADKKDKEKQEQLSKKVFGASVKKVKEILLEDKARIKKAKFTLVEKQEMNLIVDTLANVIECEDKDAIEYAFVAYKFLTRSHKFMFRGRIGAISKEMRNIVNGI